MSARYSIFGPRKVWLFLLLLGSLTAGGCHWGGPGNISGEVKYKGQPLPSGRITFVCQEGNKQSFPAAIENGRYSLTGVPQGPAFIVVQTFRPTVKAPPPPALQPALSPPLA